MSNPSSVNTRQWPPGFSSAALALLCSVWPATPAMAEIESITLRSGAYTDVGQVVKGADVSGGTLENYLLTRLGVQLTSDITVDEHLSMKIGAGGLFWYPYPVSPTQWWTKRIQFGPGISEASFQYAFEPDRGDAVAGNFIKGGFFGYKYNPDAQNLGEYLLRSEASPGIVKTGGWSFLNSAIHQSLGLQTRVSLWDGLLVNDFLLFAETDLPPIFDGSLAYVGTLRPARGFARGFEFGAGISLHRMLPVKPSAESPHIRWNGRYSPGNSYIVRNPAYVPGDTAPDPANPRYIEDTTRFYTLQGVKLMGRASFDPKAYMPGETWLGAPDLKVYVEAAVLGVRDYSYYYEDILQRIPVMFGINLPTFRALDLLALQFEYYANPFKNSQQGFYGYSQTRPVWSLDDPAPNDPDPTIRPYHFKPAAFRQDNWKWSLNAARTLTPGLSLHAQAANDYLRLRDPLDFLNHRPMTERAGHWYYVLRLQWGV